MHTGGEIEKDRERRGAGNVLHDTVPTRNAVDDEATPTEKKITLVHKEQRGEAFNMFLLFFGSFAQKRFQLYRHFSYTTRILKE